jgi:hypothetical protein
MLTAVANGTTTVRAYFQSVTGTLPVTVGGTPVTPDAGTVD